MGQAIDQREPGPGPLSPEVLRWLRRPRGGRFLLALGADWAVIVAAIAAAGHAGHALGYAAAAFIVGTRQHALAILFHEGAHGLACPDRRLNRLLTNLLCGWPILATAEGYGPWHLSHHRHLGTPDDTEAGFKAKLPYRLPLSRRLLAGLFVGDLIGLGAREVVRFWIVIRPARALRLVGPAVLWATAVGLLWWAGLLWVAGLWLAALLTAFWAVFRIRTLSEHTGLELHGPLATHRFGAGFVARFVLFPHNTWCHYEHHRWPFIPFANLPAARALCGDSEPSRAGALFASFASPRG